MERQSKKYAVFQEALNRYYKINLFAEFEDKVKHQNLDTTAFMSLYDRYLLSKLLDALDSDFWDDESKFWEEYDHTYQEYLDNQDSYPPKDFDKYY